MNKIIVPALAFCLALSGCSMFGEKPQPAPVVEVKPEPAPPPPPPPPPPPLTHTVKKGDTVAAIAKKYGVPASIVLAGNNLKSAKEVKAGMVLTIPGKTASPAAPTPLSAAKEPTVKEPAEPKVGKGKGSKSDPYGIESATAPEKGKKKSGKVDDEATFEKIKAEFHDYATKWLQKSTALSQSNKDRKEVKQEDGRYVASYGVILINTMQTEVKRVDYDDTPYVGHITYQLEMHRTYGNTAQAALASTQEEVKQESMREIFSYSGKKRAWR
ncbi:LysM peptidoglycan-binding domain-containing protein [Fundidesulfovibrio agrisoli]|uniref:LysM peptidoglycan-binding domain-containing protein n=1 Tax=Fundidesulfovibrio agrisoli TaxID=2922717 RepID=UPI001FAE4436|nr:LysM peptidoglycan-binding domain-containing protein [Fundidesulfovibrio agrisoli]